MLGTRSFKGNVFGKHMAVAGVTPEHFTRWLTYWFLRTSELCRPRAAAVLQKANYLRRLVGCYAAADAQRNFHKFQSTAD